MSVVSYLKKFVLEELKKEGLIIKMTTRRARELMELEYGDSKSEETPERKDGDFVWLLTSRGKATSPSEPDVPEELEQDEHGTEDTDVVKHPISRNARRRKLRELRSLTHKRPAKEQMDKLRSALFGDWMSHESRPENKSDRRSTRRNLHQHPKDVRKEQPTPILKRQPREHSSSQEEGVELHEQKYGSRASSIRRSVASRIGKNTWISRRALLTPRFPKNLLD